MRSPSTGTVEEISSALFPAGRPGPTPGSTWPVGGLRMAHQFQHEPVMVREVTALFGAVPPGVVVDGTVGGGGHADALLSSRPDLGVLGLDRDPDALAAAADRLARFGARAVLRHARFGDLEAQVGSAWRAGGTAWPGSGRNVPRPANGEMPGLAGVLLDLGVSSPQLDRPERGFSLRGAGPLDMRMDPGEPLTAAHLVNEASVDDLAALFAANGEGRLARRIARAVVSARPLTTTDQLAQVVDAAVPQAGRRRGHPATRVFQALRIAVNQELEELEHALAAALLLLDTGGRLVVIAYHSGEDRLVKAAMARAATGGCTCPPGLPCVCGAVPEHRLVFRGARKPAAQEVGANRRAASARLRAVERIGAAT